MSNEEDDKANAAGHGADGGQPAPSSVENKEAGKDKETSPPVERGPDEKPLPTPSADGPDGSEPVASTSTIPVSRVLQQQQTSQPPKPPSIHKRKLRRPPKGILKPAPPPTKAFSFRRDILQQLNTRLAQQGVNVQVPVPQGSLAGTAQGTAQAAGSLLGGMLRRVSGFAAATTMGAGVGGGAEDQHSRQIGANARRSTDSGLPSGTQRTHLHNLDSPDEPSRSFGQGTQPGSSSSSISESAFLTPTNNLPQPSSSVRPLRKVRFTVANMTVTYPISGAISPGEEDATRQRVERDHRLKLKEQREHKWTVAEVEKLYRDCCRMREELPLRKMRQVFQDATQAGLPSLKTIDLSFVPLDRQAIEPVADLLSVDIGLQKLVLENCGLADEGVKSILHALLVSGGLSSLSLASNKRIKYHGWRYIGIFMRRARALKYLDLSENGINRASVEHILSALSKRALTDLSGQQKQADAEKTISPANENEEAGEEEEPLTIQAKLLSESVSSEVANLTSLRMENCGLKTASLELLAHAVRYSDLSHLSLRRNRITQVGAVALSVMLKDYPDSQVATAEKATPHIANGSSPDLDLQRQGQRPSASPGAQGLYGDERQFDATVARDTSPGIPQVPYVVSSPGGGVTRRSLPAEAIASLQEASKENMVDFRANAGRDAADESRRSSVDIHSSPKTALESEEERLHTEHAALALYQAQRAKKILSSMPRMGNLLTLDLKSNDIRGGVTYLSHALKRNRTLKVLNLSDNNIEVMGLVAIADALKYNSTLETLDMSHNPCSGPSLDGITTLRNAFTLNSNLKRLFLSDTELSSEGAIALAEFLPEARSLIHLDLTENLQIDIAGVMAMAVSVKMNKSLRCLDLNIPPNAPDFARLSQDILNSCIRNTELAQRRAQQKGVKAPIAAPIYKSLLARAAKEKEESVRLQQANKTLEREGASNAAATVTGGHSHRDNDVSKHNAQQIVDAAWECVLVLRELMEREKEQEKDRQRERNVVRRADGTFASPPMGEFARDLLVQSKQLRSKLQSALGVMQEGDLLERALRVNDELETITSQLKHFYLGTNATSTGGQGILVNTIEDASPVAGSNAAQSGRASSTSPSHLAVPANEEDGLSSPNFSIGSSDDEEDEDGSVTRSRASSDALPIISADKLKSTADSALAGLGIDQTVDQLTETQQIAAREAPGDADDVIQQVDPETEKANKRAKGQLSEEGEIFRRARSLSIGEQGDDESGDEEAVETHVDNEDVAAESSKEDPINGSLPGRQHGRADSVEEKGDTSALSIASEDLKDVTGEELRQELLETHVPRRNSHSSTQSPIERTSALPVSEAIAADSS